MIHEPGDVGYWEYQREQFAKNAKSPSPELTARMVAFCKRWSNEVITNLLQSSQVREEARAIADELEPVDGDLIKAEKLADEALDITSACLAAIKRGRALERGEAK